MKKRLKKVKEIMLSAIYACIYRLCMLFPIQDKVFFSNFSGKRYGDNPRYISEKFHELYPEYKIIWQRHWRYDFSTPSYVKVVTFPSISLFYEMATSKIWVDSHLKRIWMKKRKKQLFIETWHGGLGFKKIERDAEATGNVSDEIKESDYTAGIADIFISNSEWLSQLYRRAFEYKGTILKLGYPKNDIFLQDNTAIRDSVREQFNIGANERIILYAPTFRDHLSLRTDRDYSAYDINFEKLIDVFQTKFEVQCKVLIRLQPLMIDMADEMFDFNERIINATEYPDAQKLILAADYMITDYSSIIFDFMLTRKPGFLFTADLDAYKSERGLYYELSEYPFPYGCDNESLQKCVIEFDEFNYQKRIDDFINMTGLYETGHAAKDIAYIIGEYMRDNKAKINIAKSEF